MPETGETFAPAGIECASASPVTTNWSRSLSRAVRDPDELIDRLGLPDSQRAAARAAAKRFPLLVPESYLRRMRPGDPDDPLLRQVMPTDDELHRVAGYTADPVGDAASRLAPGLIQKYAGRALLIATGSCAVHCRYCFRREYPYGDEPRRIEDWRAALHTIAADDSLHEIILSGGDPLLLTDARLRALVTAIAAVPHVKRLRIHTRLPIVLPDRVTPALISMLQESRLTPIVVVHANHPHEIADDCERSLRHLVQSGITTLNQTVLLRDVNDNIDALAELCERLINVGVLPYYLHQLDRVHGAAHFETPESIGARLVAELRRRLPGYAVPAFVREIAGEPSKTLLDQTGRFQPVPTRML